MSDISEYLSKISDDEFNKIFIKPLNNNYNSIKPFEQLMLVLPIQLSYLLPPVLKYKMNNPEEIKDIMSLNDPLTRSQINRMNKFVKDKDSSEVEWSDIPAMKEAILQEHKNNE